MALRWLLAGSALAVVVLAARGEAPRAGTADQLVAATFAALSAGDVDALVGLADPVALYALAVDCRGGETAPDGDDGDGEDAEARRREASARDPEQVRARARLAYAPRAAAAKGLAIEVLRTRDEVDVVAAGTPMLAGCVARTDVRFHRLAVDVRIRPGAEQTVSLGLTEAGGRWFLATAPVLGHQGPTPRTASGR